MNIGPGSISGGHRIERARSAAAEWARSTWPPTPPCPAATPSGPLTEDLEFRARLDREANLAVTPDPPSIVAVHRTLSADARPAESVYASDDPKLRR
ncbi:hypothetical protein [Nocardia sp. NPDC004860]|uniref:hypothetical protein n=1 Tax=Nocardia sp. NPDC004860 TaxID=3154557 RepID=UPI0033A00937